VNEAIAQLQAHVRYRLGSRVTYAQPWRVDGLTRLAVRHWPHAHLEDAAANGGRHHASVRLALLLMQAQVREQWEARHGSGPLWDAVLCGTTSAIGVVLLDLWWPSRPWRAILRSMGRSLADDRQHGVDRVVDRTGEPGIGA
jgi:hypothetical protein